MKRRKSIILILIVLAISVFTTGCMNKVKESIGSKIGEKVLEKALGEDVKIDTKSNTMSIGTKDGSFQVGENLDWPTDKMKPLPKPKAKVVSITDMGAENSITVMVNFSDSKDTEDYLQKIKDLGYVESGTTESSGFSSFVGYKDDNSQVTFAYIGTGEGTSITLTRDSESARNFFESEQEEETPLDLTGVDMTDDVEWPKDHMDKIPRLKGKITNVTTSNEYIYIELEYVSKEDTLSYIDEVKSLGFNQNATDIKTKDNIFYMAQNSKEQGLAIEWQNNRTTISYVKP